jgi:hypothetical protein
MGETPTVRELMLLGHPIIGCPAIGLQIPARTIEQTRRRLITATGIMIKEDDALAWGTGHPHPHVMLGGGCPLALEHLDGGFIHADVPALA